MMAVQKQNNNSVNVSVAGVDKHKVWMGIGVVLALLIVITILVYPLMQKKGVVGQAIGATCTRDNQCGTGEKCVSGKCAATTTSSSTATPPATCTGIAPANAQLCLGDATGLTVSTVLTLVSLCRDTTKCEYICNAGYTIQNGACVASSTTQVASSGTATPPATSTGIAPANAQLCLGDATGLTTSTPRVLISACSAAKCEYTCRSGFQLQNGACVASSTTQAAPSGTDTTTSGGAITSTVQCDATHLDRCTTQSTCTSAGGSWSNNQCVAKVTTAPSSTATSLYTCTNVVPVHARICTGDDTGLIISTVRMIVTECTETKKCEYKCDTGYIYSPSNNACLPSSSVACTGVAPANAQLCTGDAIGLTTSTPRVLISACSAAKCEYICRSGFQLQNGACVASTGGTTTSGGATSVVACTRNSDCGATESCVNSKCVVSSITTTTSGGATTSASCTGITPADLNGMDGVNDDDVLILQLAVEAAGPLKTNCGMSTQSSCDFEGVFVCENGKSSYTASFTCS